MTVKVLLDTHAIVWLDTAAAMRQDAIEAIERARNDDWVFVSPVSFWELARLAANNRLRLNLDPLAWAERFVAQQGIVIADLTVAIAVGASTLPDLDHRDPADRFLIATARANDLTLVTRDREILAYGARGHLKVMRC